MGVCWQLGYSKLMDLSIVAFPEGTPSKHFATDADGKFVTVIGVDFDCDDAYLRIGSDVQYKPDAVYDSDRELFERYLRPALIQIRAILSEERATHVRI